MKVVKLAYLFLILAGSFFANELIDAARKGDIFAVESMLNENVNVDLKNDYGNTALMDASMYGHKEIVEMLLKVGANVDLQGKYGDTALMWASQKGHEEIVEILIDAGANVNLQNKDEKTALMKASEMTRKEIVKMLLKKGADVDLQNRYGNTALMIASGEEIEDLLRAINGVESDSKKFKDIDNEIKELLINRWINLYKNNKDQQALEKLRAIKDLPIKIAILIRNFLSNINRTIPRGFEDVDIVAQS